LKYACIINIFRNILLIKLVAHRNKYILKKIKSCIVSDAINSTQNTLRLSDIVSAKLKHNDWRYGLRNETLSSYSLVYNFSRRKFLFIFLAEITPYYELGLIIWWIELFESDHFSIQVESNDNRHKRKDDIKRNIMKLRKIHLSNKRLRLETCLEYIVVPASICMCCQHCDNEKILTYRFIHFFIFVSIAMSEEKEEYSLRERES